MLFNVTETTNTMYPCNNNYTSSLASLSSYICLTILFHHSVSTINQHTLISPSSLLVLCHNSIQICLSKCQKIGHDYLHTPCLNTAPLCHTHPLILITHMKKDYVQNRHVFTITTYHHNSFKLLSSYHTYHPVCRFPFHAYMTIV